MDPAVISALHCLENDHHEQLDFEDENFLINPWETENNKREYHESSASSSSSDSSESSPYDEGEMRSSDESEFSKDEQSSEEGEVQSEIDEIEGTADVVVKKDETPWERGLRLARERLERAKALKAKEKDLVEKRMNLPVPAPAVDKKVETPVEDDFLWPCYYQVCIIGRTELTGHRYLPEDILPPSAKDTAEWRRRVTKHRRSRSASRRFSSASSSSSVSSSSRSSSRSSAASSNISSLASVAVSWKETCAKAMKPYLRSPRRHGKYDSRHSSATNSRSSDSDSGSGRSRSSYPTAASGARSGAMNDRGRSYWGAGKHRGRNIESGNSSASRSGSKSSAGSRGRKSGGNQTWFRGPGGRGGDSKNKTGRRSKSPVTSPPRRRTDVPPLPNERPVKRPWVIAPSLATTAQNVPKSDGHTKERSHSSSKSPTPSGDKDTGEKRYITSWSRSPSSGGENGRDVTVHRHERLPDVIPGPQHVRNRRSGVASPLRRKKSRSPFADDATRPSTLTNWAPKSVSYPENARNDMPNSQTSTINDQNCPVVMEQHIEPDALYRSSNTDTLSNTVVNSAQSVSTGGAVGAGELPPNRPGVRLTLAPRMKAAPVGISSLANAAPSRTSTNRLPPQPSSPPPQSRQIRPPGVPILHRHTSPIDTNQHSTVGTNIINMPMTQTQVRLQAEAAAAALEIRERRRAAAEAANKNRRPRRRKRTDLESIPVRGRPTYRRKSFSASSEASGSSSSSNSSRSPSSERSRSDSGRPAAVRHNPAGRQAPLIKHDQEGVRPSGRKRVRQDTQRTSLKEIDENTTRRHVGRSMLPNSIDPREPLEYVRYTKQSDFNERSTHRTRGTDQFIQKPIQPMKRSYPSGVEEMPVRQRPERDSRLPGAHYPNQSVDELHRVVNPESRRTAVSQFNMPTKERIIRPRTPHGLEMIDFRSRSPHADVDILPKIIRLDREQYRRVNYDVPDVSVCEKSSADLTMVDSTDSFGAKRARSRHRSRGPGVTIDRSEPFESDTGSFAAEQRLRKLRERLNLVDDAIAEIKAGTGAQSNFNFGDIRR
ncbi:unnamed protein product [Schistosoma mattheei]|uniref:Uncharacterized protein n=1 Tax=Schistosoma mattheei TaxID=31246 RepID=A0AA85ARH4_9TREM|nr:unnamed protein product [Schistosoma mattheei]